MPLGCSALTRFLPQASGRITNDQGRHVSIHTCHVNACSFIHVILHVIMHVARRIIINLYFLS